MIFRLLDAYEEEIRNKNSFFEKVKKMNRELKSAFAAWILIVAGIFVLVKITDDINVILGYLLFCIIVSFFMPIYIDFVQRKNYVTNIRDYNERLDQLDALLKKEEFSVCSGKKLVTLIKKIKDYLDSIDLHAEREKDRNRDYIIGIIIPIITYVLGVLTETDKSLETMANIFVLIFIVLCARFMINEFGRTWRIIFQSTPVKMRYLLNELQDLYDRDYMDKRE